MASPRTMRRAVSDEDKEQRRRDLLVAAKQRFAAQGFQATTIADVAKAAGVSYGVVYWYFDSKDELFHALMEDEESRLRERIAAAVAATQGASTPNLRTGLRDAVRATFEYFDEDTTSARLLFRDSLSLSSDFERHLSGIFGRFVDELEGGFRSAQRGGGVRSAPPRLVAFSVAALVGQMALRRLTTDDGLSAEEAATFTVDLLLDGLRPRPRTSRSAR